jgi:hypothetical protein
MEALPFQPEARTLWELVTERLSASLVFYAVEWISICEMRREDVKTVPICTIVILSTLGLSTFRHKPQQHDHRCTD